MMCKKLTPLLDYSVDIQFQNDLRNICQESCQVQESQKNQDIQPLPRAGWAILFFQWIFAFPNPYD